MSRCAILRSFLVLIGFLFASTSGRSVARIIEEDRIEDVLRAQDYNEGDSRAPFTLEETYGRNYVAYPFNGTWLSDAEFVYTDGETGHITKFNVDKRRRMLLFEESAVRDYKLAQYIVSPDERLLLIGYDTTAGFRHSAFRKYVVYDGRRRLYKQIARGDYLPQAQWLPNRNDLIYVLDNDIYYQRLSDRDNEVRRLTTTGVPGVIYNGVPDWVYEEEMLRSGNALWPSSDGNYLAFATFNDTNVKDAAYFYYGEPGSLDYQYPQEVKIKYPKVGTPNPLVSLNLIDLTNPESVAIKLEAPTEVVGTDNVLAAVSWMSDKVIATWMNRVQNVSQMVVYDLSGKATNLLRQKSEGWLDASRPVFYAEFMLMLKSQDSGTKAGKFIHLTRFNYENGRLSEETDLTPGAYEVQSFLGVDYVAGKAYFLAAAEGQPSQKNLYSVPVRKSGTSSPTCISCKLLTPEGNNCLYASAAFSKLKSYYALTCHGPDPVTVTIYDRDHTAVRVWETNELLRRRLATKAQPIVKDLYVNANGYDVKVRMLLPPNFDYDESYPMLVNVYAGPNTVRITDAASYGFQSYMTTNRSVIYAWIDGRGSAYKGSKMLLEIYRKMGTVEVEDQIAVAKILQESYPWIDASRTAIWGWSYGGFATAMVLAKDTKSVFKCGVSVAPVSSWIYYDSVYTERFMGLPTAEDNLAGYNATDVTRRVEGIRGKKFMLIHGTGDDNVHYQQAMALAKALEHADIPFEQVTYTDEAHGLVGVSPHLYHTMDKFWGDCLSLSHAH